MVSFLKPFALFFVCLILFLFCILIITLLVFANILIIRDCLSDLKKVDSKKDDSDD